MRAVLAVLALVAFGCSGSESPTMTTPVPPVQSSRPVVTWPESLDSEYIRALVYLDDAGREHPLRRWAPGSTMTHCFAGFREDTLVLVRRAADQMTAIARAIPEDRPCDFGRSANPDPGFVFWLLVPETGGNPGQEMLYADTHGVTAADGVTIHAAVIRFRNQNSVGFGAVHESGHALGLGHSPRRDDIMSAHGGSAVNFSPAEMLVLRSMYP